MNAAQVPVWSAIPFILLLTFVAVLPLTSKAWWERYYPSVTLGLGLVTVVDYLICLHKATPVLESGVEYISFMSLIGSLYVIAGGIHIKLRGRSWPFTNVVFLAIGALLANIVGTTGASIIMIRPFIRINNYRIKPYHVVFFVENAGKVVTHKYILEHVWGPGFANETQYTRVYVGQLRKKIEDNATHPKIIVTDERPS
jgi:Na+/H+ antiporter NhaD/arsenite permease-like protein